MDALKFNAITETIDKKEVLNHLNEQEKKNLYQNQLDYIFGIWNNCISETKNKILKIEIKPIDDKIIFVDDLIHNMNWINRKFTYEGQSQDNLFQWDIFYCDFGYNIGCEKNFNRPALIIQKTRGFLDAKTILVAPITIGEDSGCYKHEVVITETKYNRIKGKIDLLQIRSVDKMRLNKYPTDRLLKDDEYRQLFNGKEYITIQTKVKNVMKQILTIDI